MYSPYSHNTRSSTVRKSPLNTAFSHTPSPFIVSSFCWGAGILPRRNGARHLEVLVDSHYVRSLRPRFVQADELWRFVHIKRYATPKTQDTGFPGFRFNKIAVVFRCISI
jgi:hypothetical protein